MKTVKIFPTGATPLEGGIVFLNLLFSLITGVPSVSHADDPKFVVSEVPDSLVQEADAVIRLHHLEFEVKDKDEAEERMHWVVTIFNEKGRDYGEWEIYHDKFRKFKTGWLEGRVRNADGKVIKKLEDEDYSDYSAISGYALYEDNRVCQAKLYHDVYPYTVEFEYKIEHDGLINWAEWYPQMREAPVERAVFRLIVHDEQPVRYTTRHLDREPEIRHDKQAIYQWEMRHLPSQDAEPLSPAWREYAPAVLTAPVEFEIGGHEGRMSSWEEFAGWYHRLNAERGELPEEFQAVVHELVADATGEREKVRRLYHYLQQTTRYVSVQLGIGSWQTIEAEEVYRTRYGDCKALTHYMQAMLQQVGIPAYPALVRAGTKAPEIVADFPSNQFNHVILFVPLEQDSIWLECTSQVTPFGHLGTFTEDRAALVVTPTGGQLARTPKSTPQDNQKIRTATVFLDEDGNAQAKVSTRFEGNQQTLIRYALTHSSSRDRQQWLQDYLDLPTFRLTAVDFSSVDQREASIQLPLELELPRYAARAGSRLFFYPNLMERWQHVPPEVEERTQPVRLSYRYLDVDSIAYHLPAGFTVESLPEPVTFETDFGRYTLKIQVQDEGTLHYVRRLEVWNTHFAPELYAAYREFVKTIVQGDQAQVVLLRE